ncbi:hypothetical protein F5Y17DRAFT_448508 [Xylariaceae sp. FL0594]|nr:hypothetical protein F5Y17DRAFT_448508 [Xylariaceae sp. FL0594]
MMAQIRDPYRDLERHLQRLEEQVDNLIIALDDWRQWKKEYESLRTEVQSLPSTASRPALTQTRQAFKGELVDEKELVEIFGRNDSRKRDQIVSVISNRLDYVSKNIDTLTKQLDAAENKLAATRVVANPDATDEEGLPITEISEQLDDDDNVISYDLRRPGDGQPHLLDALEKAGIKNLPSGSQISAPESSSATEPSKSTNPPTPALPDKNPPKPDGAKKSHTPKPTKNKSVTFSEDTKEGDEVSVDDKSETTRRLEELYRQAREQENIITEPVIPADDSPEDAALREDMIRYNKETMMYEMAPIVAELQLEEGSDDDDDWGDEDDEWDEDDEDQWGRSTSGVVDDEYKRQMLELKERLSKKTFGELTANGGEDSEEDEFAEGIGRIAVRQENGVTTAVGKAASDALPDAETKKSVRFASSLDIAETTPPASKLEPSKPQAPVVEPVSDIIERDPSDHAKPKPSSDKKPSKFRMARAKEGQATPIATIAPDRPTAMPKYAPSGPEGKTLASTILEHEPTNEVKEPDELDANLLHQQVTEEYFKMRNKMISRQGGFLKENTNPIQPLEEEEGGPKRVSKFKAARLAGL